MSANMVLTLRENVEIDRHNVADCGFVVAYQLCDWRYYPLCASIELIFLWFPMTLMVVFVALYSSATPLGSAMQVVSEFSLDFVAGFLTGISNGQ